MHALPKRYMFCIKVLERRWSRGWNLSLGKLREDRSHGEHGEKFSASLDQHRNRAVTQSQHIQRLLFCQETPRRGVHFFAPTGSLRTLRERQFLLCFISALALRPWRASRSNSVRSKDRIPLARGAVDPGQMTAAIGTPSGSSSTTAARSASAALGFVTLIEIALVVPSLLVLASPPQPRIWHDGCRTRFIKLKRTRSQIKSLKLTETIRSKCWCRCIVCVLGACLAHVPSNH